MVHSGPQIVLLDNTEEESLNHHEPQLRATPLTCSKVMLLIHSLREEYKELRNLAGLHIGGNNGCST